MSNSYYNHGSYPSTGATGSSASLRAELDSITAGFNLLPTLTGNGNAMVKINSTGTAMVPSSAFADNGTSGVVSNVTITAVGTAATITIANTKTLTVNNTLTLAGADGKTLTVNNSIALAGTDSTTMTMPGASDTLVGVSATQTLANKTLTTPVLGVATASSINKVTLTAPATGATITILNGKTFTANNTLTLAGTDSTTITFQGTDTYVGRATTDTLSNKSLDSTCSVVTQTAGDSSTKPASTAFVGTAVAAGAVNVQGMFKNLQASATGTTAPVTVTADEISVENGSNAYATLRNVSLSIAGTSSGVANGLDTGALAASTWYSLWVIWNGTTAAGLMSLSATAPTMPGGYTHKARVGWIRTDASGSKFPLSFKQYGRKVQYVVTATGNVQGMPQLAGGLAGSTSTPTWVAVGVGNFVPTTASRISVVGNLGGTSQNLIAAPNNSYGAGGSATNPPPLMVNYTNVGSIGVEMSLESTNIYWASAGTLSYIFCQGWEDNL